MPALVSMTYLGNRQRVLDDSSGGLLLELRRVDFASWHSIPFLSR
jgi:hypothetical protein